VVDGRPRAATSLLTKPAITLFTYTSVKVKSVPASKIKHLAFGEVFF
jgi:hypothetical protein